MILEIEKPRPSTLPSLDYNEGKVLHGVAELVGYANMEDVTREGIYALFGRYERGACYPTLERSFHASVNPSEADDCSEDQVLSFISGLMEIGGYTSFSVYIRDIILQKRLPYRQETAHVSDRQLSDKINVLVYQVNKIGINYNQVVATWQKQSRQTRSDGSPYMNTQAVEARLTELMRMTEGLRDEFAVILDVVKKYIGESPDTSTI